MHARTDKSSRFPIRVGFVLFKGTKLLDVCGPLQVFNDARTHAGLSAYQIDLLSEHGGRVTTDTVCTLNSIAFKDAEPSQFDTMLISGGDSAYEAMKSETLLNYIAIASKSCRRLGSVCLGAFVLAAGGHLNARRTTTHWDGCHSLKSQFPEVALDANAIFVEDRGIWTSAGVTAGIDMALAMVSQDLDPNEALRIAKSLVLPMQRSGGQLQFSEALQSQFGSVKTRFSALIASISSDLRQNLSVPTLAAKVGMSERNFARLFVKELGCSPAKYVEQLRVQRAAEMLHYGDLAKAEYAAGFTNAEQMRRAFQRCKGVPPSEYSAKFVVADHQASE